MTTKLEEIDSIHFTEDFLADLCNPKKTPRVPREIRERAHRLLRHFPSYDRIDRVYGSAGLWDAQESLMREIRT